jgi:hypothetical protein
VATPNTFVSLTSHAESRGLGVLGAIAASA